MLHRHAFIAVVFATVAASQAQTGGPVLAPPATTAPVATPPAATATAPAKVEPEKPKTIEELTKDFTKQEGLITLYRQVKGLTDTVYLELPEGKLDKTMLLQITSASGLGDTSASFVFHGMPIADLPVKFVRQGDSRVQLTSPNLAHRANNPEAIRTIKRSFPDAILDTFEVKARDAIRKTVLLDVSNFFRSDVGELSTAINIPGYGGMSLSGTASIDTVKDFPENVVVRTVYNVNRVASMSPYMPSGPKTVPWAVSFNLSSLPESNYKPRIGDPRIGYFTVSYDDLTDQSKLDPNVNLIQRWNLEKSDPKAILSAPKKPIVFWIDNATPKEYRAAVRKGAQMYNQAFEKVGFRDAIVVKQMPDDADWDIADLRYNVIRWTTGMPFAIALFRANPLTGEILNASINMDGIFAAGAKFDFDQELDPGTYARPASMDGARARWGGRLCELVQKGAQDHANGLEALEAMNPTLPPEERRRFIDQYITEVVAHEMGHCMGLRHNFAASTEFGPQELSDPKVVAAHGIGGTVMDYNPYNIFALGKPGVDYYSQHVGVYDQWAIDYGYRSLSAVTSEGELPALRKIASESGLPGHQYQSDFAIDFDPYVMTFDLGSEPLDRLERQATLGRKMRTVARRKLVPGASYYDFTQSYLRGLSTQLMSAIDATLYLGGGRLGSSFIGDRHAASPYQPVAAAQQRRALKLIVNNLLADGSLEIRREDLARFTFNPNTPGNEASSRSRLFPMRDRIALYQRLALAYVFYPDALNRMENNEFRVGRKGDTLTMAELFHTADDTVWSEVTAKKPVSDLRRELQRAHLDLLCSMALGQVRGAPSDAKTLAISNLRTLRGRIVAAIPTAAVDYTKPHLQECLMRIDRTLDPKVTVAR